SPGECARVLPDSPTGREYTSADESRPRSVFTRKPGVPPEKNSSAELPLTERRNLLIVPARDGLPRVFPKPSTSHSSLHFTSALFASGAPLPTLTSLGFRKEMS